MALARSNLRVFPCNYPIFTQDRSVICSCYKKENCTSIGKHPAFKGWQDAATDNLIEVERIWRKNPKYNIGILTGEPNAIDVLDIDPKNNGIESLTELEAEHEPLPNTVRVRTGSGGLHLFFVHTPGLKNNNDGKIKEGIDFKTTGGYVIAPPSLHHSGKYYEWLSTGDPAPPPSWLIDKLYEEFPPPYAKKPRSKEYWTGLAYGIDSGDRHNAIASIAGLLLNSRDIKSKELAIALIHGFNQVCCKPPKSEQEVNAIIKHIGKAYRKKHEQRI